MTALEALITDPRRRLETGTRVRFKFLGNLAEGLIIRRSPETDNPELTVLYTIAFGDGCATTVQPHYAVTEIED